MTTITDTRFTELGRVRQNAHTIIVYDTHDTTSQGRVVAVRVYLDGRVVSQQRLVVPTCVHSTDLVRAVVRFFSRSA
jgi:hypothetical protein